MPRMALAHTALPVSTLRHQPAKSTISVECAHVERASQSRMICLHTSTTRLCSGTTVACGHQVSLTHPATFMNSSHFGLRPFCLWAVILRCALTHALFTCTSTRSSCLCCLEGELDSFVESWKTAKLFDRWVQLSPRAVASVHCCCLCLCLCLAMSLCVRLRCWFRVCGLFVALVTRCSVGCMDILLLLSSPAVLLTAWKSFHATISHVFSFVFSPLCSLQNHCLSGT